jgi:3',5'-cyclic AMP phosphodiesterase CpdA
MDEKTDGGLGRRELLRCMAWAGTGAVWSFAGGVAGSVLLDQAAAAPARAAGFSFVQVSDSHIGFARPPNPDARATLAEAVAKIRALPEPPAFILHTGDVSQLSRPAEWDDADQILAGAGAPVFHIPGEHDMLDEANGAAFLARYGKGAKGDGWFAFDHGGVHFVGLVNVKELRAGGMGRLGPEQLAWLKNDLERRPASTPLVVFAHIPLWTLYAEWGWGTDDGAEALKLLARFGSVTVLNGHVHQLAQTVEGTITFHTARSTAFPQPAPGTAPAPGPLVVPAERLRDTLGLRSVRFTRGQGPIALVDATLA